MADVGAWKNPVPGHLADLSPSAVTALEACPKRLAYQRDASTRHYSRPSPRTVLGTVAHRVTELAVTGRLGGGEGARERIQAAWDDEIAAGVLRLSMAWKGRTVPSPVRWPGYVATRTRLVRRLAPIVASSPVVSPPPTGVGGGPGPSLPWVERRLEDSAGGIFGTPDLVEDVAGRLRVVDLKSGVHQDEMKPGQRRQLLLYAHLVQVHLGRDVAEVAVVDVSGREEVLPVVQAEVIEAVAEVGHLRRQFNSHAQSGEIPANPSACRYCPFRIMCADYWASSEVSPFDVSGVVEAFRDGAAEVRVEDRLTRVVLVPGFEVASGTHLVALDLEPAGPSTLKMRWDSGARVSA